MSAAGKLLAFAAALAVVFGGAALAGAAIGPDPDDTTRTSPGGHGEMPSGGGAADPVRGLAVAAGGLRVVVDDPDLPRGRDETLRFRIVDEHGKAVRDFDVEHERRMHLILARRDLTGFQHLHPTMAADGTWSVPVTIDDPGAYTKTWSSSWTLQWVAGEELPPYYCQDNRP